MNNNEISDLKEQIQTLQEGIDKCNKRILQYECDEKTAKEFKKKLKLKDEIDNVSLSDYNILVIEKNVTKKDILTLFSIFELRK